MKWYKIKAIPFIRENNPNPWSVLINDNCLMKIVFIHKNNKVEAYVGINDSSFEIFEGELKRANYIIESVNEIITANKISISRKIDVIHYSMAKYYSISISENGINAILEYLSQKQGGFCIEVTNKHSMSRMLNFQIQKGRFIDAQVCSFIDEIPNAFDIVMYTFSENCNISEKIADKVISCFDGLKKSSELPSISPFVQELSQIVTRNECDLIMNIVKYLGKYGVEYNNDTLIEQSLNYNNNSLPDYYFGESFSGNRKIGISKKELCQHVFIAGGSGSGKGNLLINLAMQFYHNDISFLIIESAKNELHNLAKWIPSLKVWRPEKGKFVLNPFYLPEGIEFDKYRNSLSKILHSFFNIDSPDSALPGLFEDSLKRCCSKFINHPANPTQFGVAEFITEYRNLSKLKEYDSTIEKRLRTAGINRAQEPITDEMVFDSSVSIPIQEFINGFNILQLECLDTDEGKAKVAFVLLTQILAYLKNKYNKELNLVIIIDESHVLLKNTPDCQISEYFHKMIDEFRSRGISIIVADQSANNIPDEIVNDSYTKVFLGGNDKTGITNFASKAKLDELAYKNLFNLTSGQGIMISDNNSSGKPFVSEDLITKLDITYSCEYQNSYLENNRITIETYRECDTCIYKGKCTFENKKEAKKYADYFYNLNEYLLHNYFSGNGVYNKKYSGELLNKICEETSGLNEETFGCYLKQVFRKYNMEHGDNNIKKYDKVISELIKYRKK